MPNGSGDGKLGGIALYGTKQHDDGRYIDIIARVIDYPTTIALTL